MVFDSCAGYSHNEYVTHRQNLENEQQRKMASDRRNDGIDVPIEVTSRSVRSMCIMYQKHNRDKKKEMKKKPKDRQILLFTVLFTEWFDFEVCSLINRILTRTIKPKAQCMTLLSEHINDISFCRKYTTPANMNGIKKCTTQFIKWTTAVSNMHTKYSIFYIFQKLFSELFNVIYRAWNTEQTHGSEFPKRKTTTYSCNNQFLIRCWWVILKEY